MLKTYNSSPRNKTVSCVAKGIRNGKKEAEAETKAEANAEANAENYIQQSAQIEALGMIIVPKLDGSA